MRDGDTQLLPCTTPRGHPALTTPPDVLCEQWRMLSWAWLICFAFVPEMTIKQLARSSRFDSWRGRQGWCTASRLAGTTSLPRDHPAALPRFAAFRHVCALGAAINIAALMAANLVGFVLGLDGLTGVAERITRNRVCARNTSARDFIQLPPWLQVSFHSCSQTASCCWSRWPPFSRQPRSCSRCHHGLLRSEQRTSACRDNGALQGGISSCCCRST